VTKSTGRPVGRPRDYDEDASVLGADSKRGARSAMAEIANALTQLGANNKGEIDIYEVDPQRTTWYVDTIDASGFSVPALRERVGAGRFELDIFAIGQDGRRKRIRKVPVNMRPVPGTTPAPASAAAPVLGGAAEVVTLMSTAMGGMAKAFEAVATQRGPDVLDVVKALAPILKPTGGGEITEYLKLFREGMQLGRENGAGSDSTIGKALDTVKPLIDRIGDRIQKDGEQKRVALPAGTPTPTVNGADMQLQEVMAEIGPYIRKRLARGIPPEQIAPRVLEDLFDLVGPEQWGQLLALSTTEQFDGLLLAHLTPAVGAEHNTKLVELVKHGRVEMQRLAAQDSAEASAT
jgi:hypothetical protein